MTITSIIISRKKRHRCLLPNWKWSNIWCHRKFHYWIVCNCRLQPRHCNTCLYVSFLPLSHCNNNRRWRRGIAHAKSFFNHRCTDAFFSGNKDGYCLWESEGITNNNRDSFCDDKNQYFLQLHRLLSSFTKIDHVENITD